ncbi:MAG: hypothetical protein QM538_04470 [Methylacidiphilales bacterium]|nr:hypothetical protein [Candidatus Methylacidiphilales bacterium]
MNNAFPVVPFRDKNYLISFALLCLSAFIISASALYLYKVYLLNTTLAQELLQSEIKITTSYPNTQTIQIKNKATSLGLFACDQVTLPGNIFLGTTSSVAEIQAIDDCALLAGWFLILDQHGKRRVTASQKLQLNRHEIFVGRDSNVSLGSSVTIANASFTVAGIILERSDSAVNTLSIVPQVVMRLDDATELNMLRAQNRASYATLYSGSVLSMQSFRSYLSEALQKGGFRVLDSTKPDTLPLRATKAVYQVVAIYAIFFAILSILLFVQSSQSLIQHENNLRTLLFHHGVSARKYWKYVVTLLLLQWCAIFICVVPCIAILYLIIPYYLPSVAQALLIIGVVLSVQMLISVLIRVHFTNAIDRIIFLGAVILLGFPSYSVFIFSKTVFTSSSIIKMVGIGGLSILAIFAVFSFSLFLIRKITRLPAWGYIAITMNKHSLQPFVTFLGISIVLVLVSYTQLLSKAVTNKSNQLSQSSIPNMFALGLSQPVIQSLTENSERLGIKSLIAKPLYRANRTNINNQEEDDNREINITTDATVASISLEKNYAKRQAITLGDEFTFSLYGIEISGVVSELREVRWESFEPNFFISVNPSLVVDFPHSYIASWYLPQSTFQNTISLLKQYPFVTVFDLRSIIAQAVFRLEFIKHMIWLLTGAVYVLVLLSLLSQVFQTQFIRLQVVQNCYDHGVSIAYQKKQYLYEQIFYFVILCLPSLTGSLYLFRNTEDLLELYPRMNLISSISTGISSSLLILLLIIVISFIALYPKIKR